MNVGRSLFAQVMEYVPWKTFERIIKRHNGDAGVRILSCADLFRVMAFSQLTWRESLRDIEVCLTANQNKLFHMGLACVPARSTLSDALNLRDWRIYHALAMRLIARARDLYAEEQTDLALDATVYALDSTTIDLCLSLFDWAPFRSTKAAVKMHTLLDLRGKHPNLRSHQRWQDGRCQSTRYPAHRSRRLLRYGSRLSGFQSAFLHASNRSVFCNPCQTETERPAGLLDGKRSQHWDYLRPGDFPQRLLRCQGLSGTFAAHPLQRPRFWQNPGPPDQQYGAAAIDYCRDVQKPLAGGAFLQIDQATPSHQAFSGYQRKCGQNVNLVRRGHLRADRYH